MSVSRIFVREKFTLKLLFFYERNDKIMKWIFIINNNDNTIINTCLCILCIQFTSISTIYKLSRTITILN